MISYVNENRQYIMLGILFRYNFVTLEYMTDKLSVSDRTIKNYIKELNNMLGTAGLIEIKRGICRLYIFDYKNFKDKYDNIRKLNYFFDSLQNRMNYIMYKLLSYHDGYLIDDLALEMNISRTTLIGDLKKLRYNLKSYNLNISGKTNKGLYIVGNEINIRSYIIENLDNDIFDNYILDEEFIDIIKFESYKKGFVFESIKLFLKYYSVSLIRYINGYEIKNLDKKFLELEDTSAYKFVENISVKIQEKINIEIPKNEKLFITLPIIGMQTPINFENIDDLYVSDEALNLTIDIIAHINKKMDIRIVPGELFNNFIYHINFMLNRIKYNVKIKNCVIEEIKEKYSLAYKIAEVVGKFIDKRFNVELCENELGFLAMYFGVFMMENNNNNINKIAIVCDTGIVATRLIIGHLNKILVQDTKMDIFCSNFMDIKEDEYDLIVTTMNLDINTNIPIIHLKEVFDIDELRKKISILKYSKILNKPILKGVEFLMLSMLIDKNFIVLDSDKDYFQNLNAMIDHLYEQNLVDCGFRERILYKEKKSSMFFENISLPHSINYSSDELILLLGVFNNPIKLYKNDLKLIFLLVIPDNEKLQKDILVKIYDEIICIANDAKVVDKISKFKDYKELVLYFIKEIQGLRGKNI